MCSVGKIATAINDDFSSMSSSSVIVTINSSMSSSSVIVTINAAHRLLHIIHLILRSLRFSSSLSSRRSKHVICTTYHACHWQTRHACHWQTRHACHWQSECKYAQ